MYVEMKISNRRWRTWVNIMKACRGRVTFGNPCHKRSPRHWANHTENVYRSGLEKDQGDNFENHQNLSRKVKKRIQKGKLNTKR